MKNKLMYYDHVTKELSEGIEYKASKLVKLGCVKTVSRDKWIIKAIPGYNKVDKVVYNTTYEGWSCNCQGFKRYNTCSHIRAVMLSMRGKDD